MMEQTLEGRSAPIVRHPAASVLIGAVVLAGLVLAILLYVAGGRAAHGQTRYPMHNVIGMPLNRAVAALKRPGAQVHVTRARYGQYNVVLRATGIRHRRHLRTGIADRAAGRRARRPRRRSP